MQRDGTDLLYSARDLLSFLGCVHSTALDRVHLSGAITLDEQPADEYLELLKQKGNEHERDYLEKLRASGLTIQEIERVDSLSAMAEATRQAMREGVDVIYQGALVGSPWFGYSDFLMKVDAPSRLGPYSYEVADTKLARTARPKHVVQLCLYAELLGAEQGRLPENAQVVLGDGTTFPFRLRDYRYYCRSAQDRFLEFVATQAVATAAEPCEHCQMCRWSDRCEHEWVETDHLSLVARINRTQRKRLVAHGITTLASLATLPGDAVVPKVQRETLDRIRSQAALQFSRRQTGQNCHELLPLASRRGFARLPKPDEGDLFFDMEGDPIFSKDGGLEYLFGFHHVDQGKEQFTPFWAHDRASERKAFEDAMDFMTDRLRRFPGAYIYHYASYEETALKKLAQKYGAAPAVPAQTETQPAALKRLAQEYGTRENEVDDLLRNRKLVDLYKVVREGIRISEPSYSLKNLEVFFAPERTQDIKAGGDSIVAFERWLVLRDPAILRQLEEYNAFDCRSTRLCRDWLIGLRPPEVTWFDPAAETAEDDQKEREREAKRRENDSRILQLRTALLDGVPDDERPWRELLGYLLEYHRREARREWWEFFDRLYEKTREQLIDDADAIAGLMLDRSVPPRKEARSRVWTLSFPEQETKLRAGSRVVRVDTEELLEIVSIDEGKRRLELKIGPSRQELGDDIAIIAQGPLDDRVQREALVRYAEAVIAGYETRYTAVTSILRKDRPSLRGGRVLGESSGDLLSHTVSVVEQMAGTHVVIQGPPGSGKTFTSAHAIVELLRNGKRVGVTSLSHKAINNLLRKVEDIARERGVSFRGVKKSGKDDESLKGSMIADTPDNAEAADDSYDLVAGTAWLLSRPEFDQKLDYLFVDEAGQLSLATVIATGVSARNIVLVGDQMQLSQPIKGAHPGGSGVSVLDYLVGDWPTVPPDRGVFLSRTWRMHPMLCEFVSDAFYDGRLEAVDGTARQGLDVSADGAHGLAPFGLRFVGVPHEDNGQKSIEEARLLDAAYRYLLDRTWVDFDGATRTIGLDDILVVSPYNMQVNLLEEWLPDDARIGTVDRFQGQEAAVVLISMAASSGEHVPRGIDFLFSPNRLNVAISRARCLSVVFASERLLATASHSVGQLRRVNTMCWAKAFSNSTS